MDIWRSVLPLPSGVRQKAYLTLSVTLLCMPILSFRKIISDGYALLWIFAGYKIKIPSQENYQILGLNVIGMIDFVFTIFRVGHRNIIDF